jgi:predicted dehydrogenase/threonine dehydrogenase-like Zn-dependent dehydrogenase
MKQLLYSPREGEIEVVEVPAPGAAAGCVLVRTGASVLSAGTERMAVEFARKSMLEKARSRPDLVRQVVSKARRDGALTALRAVGSRLDRPSSLGYSSAGTVLEVGEGVSDLAAGDRVACAGAGYAAHAEIVCVPRNLVAKIPEPRVPRREPIEFEEAAFATLGAIAMHGLRLAEPQIGETVAVIGLGLVGLLAVQLARAAGCTVFGMDPDPERCRLAETLGCAGTAAEEEEFASLIAGHTEAIGADAAILAAATPSQGPVTLAGEVARERGRVIAVGAVGTEVPRKLYYEKELDFRISRSYGPGRYDREYEEKGHDYPIEYVRWTENRNLKAFLQLLAQGEVDVRALISHRFAITAAGQAYDVILGKTKEPFLGVILAYGEEGKLSRRVDLASWDMEAGRGSTVAIPRIGFLGAGNFALGVLIPAIRRTEGTRLAGVCATSGANAGYAARKFGFSFATTDPREILEDPEINTVVIATPHRQHAEEVIAALGAGKNVFCEKPLCVSEAELTEIVRAYMGSKEPRPQLMVGFNRRFAPMARALKEMLAERGGQPLVMHYRVNAGPAPEDGWMRDKDQRGRIVGEACHFVDLLTFLAGEAPVRVFARRAGNQESPQDDSTVIVLEFTNGSLGTISYVANGDKAFSKERLEVFCDGSVGVIDDFRRMELVRHGRRKTAVSHLRQDKGHRAEWQAFDTALRTAKAPIPFEEIVATTLVTFRILDSLERAEPVEVGRQGFFGACLDTAREERLRYSIESEVRSNGHV